MNLKKMNDIKRKMIFLQNLLYRIFRREPIHLLGRWNIDYCHKMNQKIDFSNYDHSLK
jgi:hypothetical protein